ncbi:MAG: hypothetical protein MR481_03790 [Campylobacter sp.]|uniref:hypothetical protein n=1 Tax=Campylobacter sp. TaxID=205 RepID=UPI002AA7E827|nr:hypothetical protein [Campylobacter sp.]MCI7247028.1 hypothetical protein [Campylobacter sp.]
MPKLDETKERLGVIKLLLSFFMTTFIALISFIALNYRTYSDPVVFYGACTVAFILLVFIFFGWQADKGYFKRN